MASILITSERHHGPKTEAIIRLCSRYENILSGYSFIEGLYDMTKKKSWEYSLHRIYEIAHENGTKIAQMENNRQRAINDRDLNSLKPNLVALLSLPEDLNRYLTL